MKVSEQGHAPALLAWGRTHGSSNPSGLAPPLPTLSHDVNKHGGEVSDIHPNP